MKKVTKLFALILVAVMILSVFSGCGTKNGNNVSNTDSFAYWVPLDTSSSQTMQSFNEQEKRLSLSTQVLEIPVLKLFRFFLHPGIIRI